MPRFATEWVAFVANGEYYYPACAVSDLEPGEMPDAVGITKCFALFGFGLFPSYGTLYGPETPEYRLLLADTDNQ